VSQQLFTDVDLSLIGIARFSANTAGKIKFEIYGDRNVGSDKYIGTVEETIQDLLDARDGDGGE